MRICIKIKNLLLWKSYASFIFEARENQKKLDISGKNLIKKTVL